MIFTIICSAVLGVVSTILDCGWFNENGLNIKGIIVNIIGVLIIVVISRSFKFK